MDMKKLINIFDQLVALIESDNPEKAFEFMISEYGKLQETEKDVLRPFIKRHFKKKYKEDKLSMAQQMYFVEIVNALREDKEGSELIATMKLTEKISDKQITKLFYELKTTGYIENTNTQIAQALSAIFNLNYNTVLSYLKNPTERFANLQLLFTKKI